MRIKFSRMNFESQCAYDVINDRGFLISEMPYSDVDKSVRNLDGPRSPRFGTVYSDMNAYAERFRCKCGKYVGAQFEGEICPECHTVIEFKDVDILYTGWINLSPYKIINPLSYHRLQSALSKKVLENIISNDNIITSQGIIRKHNESIEVKKTMLMYHNIGLSSFYENYHEIMEYYKTKRKAKADLIDQLIREKDLVFTSKIPVYTTQLRPSSVTTESFYFTTQERLITVLTNISINLKKATPIEVPLYLFQCQQRVNELWDKNFTMIDGKHGWIRGQTLGGSFNSTARSVIVLDPTLKMDEVDIPYKTFANAYAGLIVKRIMHDKGWTLTRAYNYLKAKFNFDDYVYSVIESLLKEEDRYIIINRNPTITFGSILEMRIRKVKKDPYDLTLSLPSAILPGQHFRPGIM